VSIKGAQNTGTVVKQALGMVELDNQMYLAEAKITALNYSQNEIIKDQDLLKSKACKTCNYDQIFDKCDN